MNWEVNQRLCARPADSVPRPTQGRLEIMLVTHRGTSSTHRCTTWSRSCQTPTSYSGQGRILIETSVKRNNNLVSANGKHLPERKFRTCVLSVRSSIAVFCVNIVTSNNRLRLYHWPDFLLPSSDDTPHVPDQDLGEEKVLNIVRNLTHIIKKVFPSQCNNSRSTVSPAEFRYIVNLKYLTYTV